MVVSFDRYHFFGLLGMIVYPLIVFELAQLSLIHAVYKLRFILPFVCFVGLLNPIFDNMYLSPLFWGHNSHKWYDFYVYIDVKGSFNSSVLLFAHRYYHY